VVPNAATVHAPRVFTGPMRKNRTGLGRDWQVATLVPPGIISCVGLTTGVKLRGPEGAQRLRATSASTSELAGSPQMEELGSWLISNSAQLKEWLWIKVGLDPRSAMLRLSKQNDGC
jgi:hypothetical protein